MSRLIDLTGQTFGYWEVLQKAENSKDGRARWLCRCKACGKEKIVQGAHLRGGRSTNCGCVRLEKMRQASMIHEEGKTYGFLQVIREATPEEKPRQNRTGVYWNCKCLKCGKENVIVFGDYLRNGDTKSCGCLNSINESIIEEMLKELKLNYKKQVWFNDLRAPDTNYTLRFDFGVYNNNHLLYLLEYDGEQHFDRKHAWSDKDFERCQKSDALKNEYCKKHSIPLIRLRYDKSYTKEDLLLERTRFLI